jgi:hypothetical protein
MPVPRLTGQSFYDAPGIGTRAGLTTRLHLGPGFAALSVVDQVRRENAQERAAAGRRKTASVLGASMVPKPVEARFLRSIAEGWEGHAVGVRDYSGMDLGELSTDRVPSRVITEWSGKSRRRMLKAFCSVDWTTLDLHGCPLGMVTLTYPGDWQRCAPNGKTVKRHLRAFRQAFYRAMGYRLDGAWKMEFQDRGAAHFHLFMPVPAVTARGVRFETWLSSTWAKIVTRSLDPVARAAHILEGHHGRHVLAGTGVDFSKVGRMSDPKRLAVYFYKHGTKTGDGKEYQHNVPREWLVDEHGEVMPENGPGRFWGFWGMKPLDVVVELDVEDFLTARRILRKVAKARSRAVAYSRARHVLPVDVAMHPARVRKMIGTRAVKSRVLTGGRMQGGFVIVNDGTRLAYDLARALNLSRLQ